MKFIIMTALSLLATPLLADWAVKGEGNFSCPEYVAEKRINSTKFYSSVTWVQGFISGVNYQRALDDGMSSFIGQDFPATAIVSWLENHCRANPQDYLSDAAEALVIELKAKE